jgi:hypothetical protein
MASLLTRFRDHALFYFIWLCSPAWAMASSFTRFCDHTLFYFLWLCSPARAMASSFTKFLDHTQRRATVGRTPLDEWSARRRDLYLTTHNRQISTAPVGFRTHDCSRRAAVDLSLRPRGHWDRQINVYRWRYLPIRYMLNMFCAAHMVTTLADILSTVPCSKLSIRNIFTYLQLSIIF